MDPTDLGAFQRASFNLLPASESIEHDEHRQSIRCISDLVYFNAVKNPHHVFCLQSWKVSNDSASNLKYTYITYSQLAQAMERCCDWILRNVPGASEARLGLDGSISKSAPIALLMESDVGLFIYMLSLLTLNIPCLLLSIKLSLNAARHLVTETFTAFIITTSRMSSSARNIQSQCDHSKASATAFVTAAPFEEFLATESPSGQPLQRVSSSQQLVRESDRNVLILHSSGTTGLPKAIPLAHRYLLGYAACHLFPPNEDEHSRGINLSTLPLYHGFGALAPCLALSVGKTVCFLPASTIPTASSVNSLLDDQRISSLMTVPNIMEEMTQLEEFSTVAEHLTRLDFVAVGGGGMKPDVAKMLHERGVKLLNHFGATELGALAPIFRPGEDYDYRYLRLRTDLGLRLIFSDGDLKSGPSEPRSCKLLGQLFAWDSEFELQDALENNPLRPTSEVRILGRNDDIVVLATGEKVTPNILEQTVEAHPDVKTAVVIGQDQFEIGLLIEPASECIDTAEFVDRIWPHVFSANARMDRHARVSTKAAVLVKPASKDIPRTDKGSVRRREVYEVFKDEIRTLYERLDLQTEYAPATELDFSDLRPGIRNIVKTCLPEHVQHTGFGDDDDLINLGLDSLQATRLRRQLRASLHHSRNNDRSFVHLPLDFVYSNPSITQLEAALIDPKAQQDPILRKEQMMEDMSLSDDEIQDIYAANLLGPIRLIQAILPHMRARNQGTISAVGGVGALNGAGGAGHFCASKAGLTIAMQALQAEVAHLGIKVCFIQLGHFRTAFLEAGHRIKTQKSMEDYQPLMGPTEKAFDTLNGTQEGSPASAGKAIVEVLSGTGRARGREMPGYLELGADVRAATLQAQAFRDHQASVWEDVSTSTNL